MGTARAALQVALERNVGDRPSIPARAAVHAELVQIAVIVGAFAARATAAPDVGTLAGRGDEAAAQRDVDRAAVAAVPRGAGSTTIRRAECASAARAAVGGDGHATRDATRDAGDGHAATCAGRVDDEGGVPAIATPAAAAARAVAARGAVRARAAFGGDVDRRGQGGSVVRVGGRIVQGAGQRRPRAARPASAAVTRAGGTRAAGRRDRAGGPDHHAGIACVFGRGADGEPRHRDQRRARQQGRSEPAARLADPSLARRTAMRRAIALLLKSAVHLRSSFPPRRSR